MAIGYEQLMSFDTVVDDSNCTMDALRVPDLDLPDHVGTLRGSRSWSGFDTASPTTNSLSSALVASFEELRLQSAESVPSSPSVKDGSHGWNEHANTLNDRLSTSLSDMNDMKEGLHNEVDDLGWASLDGTEEVSDPGLAMWKTIGPNLQIPRLSQQSSDRELARALLVSGDSSQRSRRLLPTHLQAVRSWTYNDDAPTWKFLHRADIMTALAEPSSVMNEHTFEGKICTVCKSLNLWGIAMMDGSVLTNEGSELCSFVGLHQSMSYSSCMVCRAFASLLSTGTTSAQTAYTLADGKIRALPASHLSGKREGMPNHVVVGISLERNPIRWDAVAGCTTELQGLILPIFQPAVTKTALCHGLKLQTFVGFPRLRSMLSICAHDHRICQTPTHKFPINARVIDCHARKVVKLREHYRYLALSYVWGIQSAVNIPNPSDLASTDLPASLPRTIEDAISATIKLRLRFLWCDRYCIEQFHSADKSHQINQMASIYNRAVATICALGSDDEVGLPGVSSSRCAFPSLGSNGTAAFSVCPAPILLVNHISMSRWFTRGW